jgi:hypothetical protein
MHTRTQYIIIDPLGDRASGALDLENRLLELGMQREAFCIKDHDQGHTSLEFWEPDRTEALRYLDGIETARRRLQDL